MLGKTAVAAVSLSGNLMFLVLALTQMLGVGTTALIAHATGRKDRDEARLIFNQSQVLSLVVGVRVLRGDDGAARPVRARRSPPIRRRRGWPREYLTWFIPSLALQFAMVATASALRGIGDFKPGMVDPVGDGGAEHRARAGADVRLGDGPSAGRRGHRDRVVHRGRRRRGGADLCTSCASDGYLEFARAASGGRGSRCGGAC